jgi:hypothetical protein
VIQINSLYKIIQNSEALTIRVLYLYSDMIFVIEPQKNQLPYRISLIDFQNGLQSGTIEIVEHDDFLPVINSGSLSDKYLSIRDKAYYAIENLVTNEPDIYISDYRKMVVKESSLKAGISEQSVINYLKRYWSRGKTKNALIPDYLNCGCLENALNVKKRGRRRTGIENGIPVTEDTRKIFNVSLNKYYYNTRKNSLKVAYMLMLKEYYPRLDGEMPSFGQFRYHFEKNRDYMVEISSRNGLKDFLKNNREILGSARDDVLSPGTFEIDSTIADVYLVSRFNRNWIVGRPTIYVLIDKFSNYIGGIYVGLESSSYVTAAMCILNCLSDKVEYCRNYGIEITSDEWNIKGLPNTIIADRGELEGFNIENIIEDFGIVVKNTPPYRGDLKSGVERFFGYINEYIKPVLAGVVDCTTAERGDIDYRLKAKLDLFEFTHVIIKCVLHYNNEHVIKNYPFSSEMLCDNVTPTPKNLWNWGIANRGSSLKYVDIDYAKSILLCKNTATITAKGIKFRGMYYASDRFIKEQLFVKARIEGRQKVDIRYDPRDLDKIFVYDMGAKAYESCHLLSASKQFCDKYIEEVENLEKYITEQKPKWEQNELKGRINLETDIEQIVDVSKSEFQSEKSVHESKSEKLRAIRTKREIEKTINRSNEAIQIDTNEPQPTCTDDSYGMDYTDVLNLIGTEQERKLKELYNEGE